MGYDTDTAKGLLLSALEQAGETPADLEAVFVLRNGAKEIEQTTFDAMPERPFHAGYGSTEGEPCIAFSRSYVYICGCYDGSEWMEAIPRHPASVSAGGIPCVGGG